ncbi:MAG: triose-phosphate isomerase [Actinomycetota bacterium]|nr:triose-phosphate isomerase [Actinomycetota bacterium]
MTPAIPVRRRPLVSGNWKMNFDHHQAIHAARDLGLRLRGSDTAAVDISLHPPFTDLRSVQTVLEADDVPVALGAQNCAVEDAGAFTGEVSAPMLAKLHVEYVIVGHSERRRLFGETDEVVAAKLRAVVRNGMTPICCVGETLEEREAGATTARLTAQVEAALGAFEGTGLPALVVAYEPLWAIGTGRAASAQDAEEAAQVVRSVVARARGDDAAGQLRVQYGGSVTPENAAELLAPPDVDGLLVGGASLDPAQFVAIVRAAHPPR